MIGNITNITFLFHIVVVALNAIRKFVLKFSKITWSILVSALVIGGVGWLYMTAFLQIQFDNPSLSSLITYIDPCEPLDTRVTDKKIILRLDDVQAGAYRSESVSMIRESLDRDMPIVAGVIPKDLNTDSDVVNFLKKNECNIEIAQHGFDHKRKADKSHEFENVNYDEANTQYKEGKKILEYTFSQSIDTFIPPGNRISSDATRAFLDNGYSILSTEGEKKYDYDVSTYDWVEKTLNTTDTIIQKCDKTFETTDVCIIMLHPQDYTIGSEFIDVSQDNFTELLDALNKREDLSFTTFRDYYKSQNGDIQPKQPGGWKKTERDIAQLVSTIVPN